MKDIIAKLEQQRDAIEQALLALRGIEAPRETESRAGIGSTGVRSPCAEEDWQVRPQRPTNPGRPQTPRGSDEEAMGCEEKRGPGEEVRAQA